MSGHLGDVGGAHRAVTDPAPSVRAAAIGALSRLGELDRSALGAALADESAVVRRRACELIPGRVDAGPTDLVTCLHDPDVSVVEAACFALGETGPEGAGDPVLALADVATGHVDPLCREAAVAALGAIGDRLGLDAILAATTDKPAVRRRAILALAPFSGDQVDAALQIALSDRDWQVRQAAEDLTVVEADPTTS